jgi:hypothetical protein
MTERRGDPGFSVAPRRIGDDRGPGGPRRARRLGVALIVAAAAAIITVAWLGPRLSGRPSFELSFFATPTPRATATPSQSAEPTPSARVRPTPLPEITRIDGSSLTGALAIGGAGMRILDLASGEIDRVMDTTFGREAIVRAPDGDGWICVCLVDDVGPDGPVQIARVVRFGQAGAQRAPADVLTLPARFIEELGQDDPTTDVDIRPDGRRGLLAIANREAGTFRFRIVSLDTEAPAAGPFVELETEPDLPAGPSAGPSVPPVSISLDGPHVRIAPGGRVAFVWGVVQGTTEETSVTLAVHAWRVALAADGSIDEVAAIDGFDRLPMFCSYVAFATSDRLAWLCQQITVDASNLQVLPLWQFTTIDLEGRLVATGDIATDVDTSFVEPLFDRANGQVYAWDSLKLTLLRIDARTLDQGRVTIDPAADAAPGIAPARGGDRPDWHDADSAVQMLPFSQIAAAPDGSQLYLLGYGQATTYEAVANSSLGIFVVDRATLALVDRWAPAADYVGLSVRADGRVLASGVPGVDASGREAPWQGSLTVHDPVDGRILARFGRLGTEVPLLVVDH